MTPADFETAFRPEALVLAERTGLDPDLFLAQWAVETGWATGWAGAPCNLGNIECGPGVFCQYASLSEFVDAETAVLRQPNMAAVLASRSGDLLDQMAALGASPWDAGHYRSALPAYLGRPLFNGSQLHQFWEELRMSMLQEIHDAVTQGFTIQRLARDLGTPDPEVPPFLVDRIKAALPAAGGGLSAADRQLLQDTHDAVARIEKGAQSE